MFGYVRAYKPDMTFSQYDIYKGIYCSLCKKIGKSYGLLARMTLSYDFAFFSLFRMSVESTCSGFSKSRCSFNPTKKCLQCNLEDKDLEFSADVSMLMVCYKFLDNLQDSHGIKHILLKILSPYFNSIHQKAMKRAGDADEILKRMHFSQLEVEKRNTSNIDEACHPSADALGKLLALGKGDELSEELYRFGYLLGRWVYLIDALDDYEDDKKNDSFNPFVVSGKSIGEGIESLNLTQAEAINSFERIKVYKYKKIITNVLFDGLHFSMNAVKERKENEKSL